jgi:hypothetical protein
VKLGSHRAAILSARFGLLAAVLRDPALKWITGVDELFAAENKLVQYRAAAAIGIRVPRTLVASDARELGEELGGSFVLKPLGPGNFDLDGDQHLVHVRRVGPAEIEDTDLMEAPFLAQEAVAARSHLRVVTVLGRAWVCELGAADLPVDWREVPAAHHAFVASTGWPDVEQAALALTRRLHVGFSSQDWIVDNQGPAFLDLNPGGQWLFLPRSITVEVTRELARWLAGF